MTNSAPAVGTDWRQRSKPIQPGSPYPAKEHCSRCGLCDSYYIAHVKDACAFLGDGMGRISSMEEQVHGRSRDLEDPDELRFGVHKEFLYARSRPPVEGAQWTGLVSSLAIAALESGLVDGVVCVQSDEKDRFAPKPVIAKTAEDIRKAAGVKPTLSPNLEVLAAVEASGLKKLLFIGVGCQVQALRAVEPYLGLEKLYIVGTNCVDNGPRDGLDRFLNAASTKPEQVLHYEFMADYRVHLKHLDGSWEKIPYFCLPANELAHGVIAESCMTCFDYTNAGADVAIGYMGVPPDSKTPMTASFQSVTIRNERGMELLELLRAKNAVETAKPVSGGLLNKKSLVMQTVIADDEAKFGRGPEKGAPKWIGEMVATVLTWIGPKGMNFAKYSIDYHYVRNYLYVNRVWGEKKASRHIPAYAKKIVEEYEGEEITKRLKMKM